MDTRKEYHSNYRNKNREKVRLWGRNYYQKTKQKHFAQNKTLKSKSYEANRKHRNKLRAVGYLGGKCIVCGYSKCIGVLEFHHKNNNDKENDVSGLLYHTWKTIVEELDKCELLCANCHRELHYIEWAKRHQ
jgi:hypothetical protein